MSISSFNESELAAIGTFPGVENDLYYFPEVVTKKLNTPITPRKNWELFFDRKPFYWVPDLTNDTNYTMSCVVPDNVAFSYTGGVDSFGVTWVPDESCPELPAMPDPKHIFLKDIADWKEIKFPDVDSWDWAGMTAGYANLDRDRWTATFAPTGMVERMAALMGFANAASAFLEDSDSCHDFLDRLLDYNLDIMEHNHKYLKTDLYIFSDDWGTQRAPFFSTKIVEEFFVPHVKALADRAHSLGMRFMHHCCGNVNTLVPAMIEEGIDAWQFNYEAVRDGLPGVIDKYGDKLLFDGYFGLVDPLPEDDGEFKTAVRGLFKKFGATKICSMSSSDYTERSFDARRFWYEEARRTVCG